MGELEVALAQIFRKKAKSSMSEKDFVFAASLDFRWFSPKEAQRLLEVAVAGDLLALDGGMVRPTFDYKGTEVPKGYAPGPDILEKAPQPKVMLMKIMDAVSAKSSLPVQDVVSRVNRIQDSMGLDSEVAALIAARELDVDVSEFYDAVEEGLGKRYKK